MNEVFDCNTCRGVCCIQPPQLNTKEDLEIAIKHGVKILALKLNDKDRSYILTIDKVEKAYREVKVCPFLNEESQCDIHGEGFSVCKAFECHFMGVSTSLVLKAPPQMLIQGLVDSPLEHREKPILYTLSEVKKLDLVEIIDFKEMMKRVYAVKLEPLLKIVDKIIASLKG